MFPSTLFTATMFVLLGTSSVHSFVPVAPPSAAVPVVELIVNFAPPSLNTLASSSSSTLPSHQELLWASSNTLAAATVAPTTTTSATTATSPTVFIADINYDGKVATTEADEYVVLTNGGKTPLDVSGYYIYVATTGTQGPTFTFPKGSVIKPGASVRIYNNEIHKETGGYSFGSGKALWNNRGGLAVLREGGGKKMGEFKYKPATSSS